MAIASGVEKRLVFADQSGKGVIAAVDAASAQILRRVSSNLDQSKETYQSNEIRADRQVGDFRHGVESVDGTISGELSPGTYEALMAAILRQDWIAGVDTGSLATCVIANNDTANAATAALTSDETSPTEDDTVTIGTTVYTFMGTLSTDPTVAYEVLIGANAAAAMTNLTAAINGSAGAGTTYGTGTVAHPDVTAAYDAYVVTVTAAVGGYAGNLIAKAEEGTHTAWDAGSFLTLGRDANSFTRDDGGGDFLEDGFKVGDVIRWTGLASPATANNSHNFLITAVTDTDMTTLPLDGTAVVTRDKVDTVTGTVTGKKIYVPASGHTEDYFTFEHNYSDRDLSEVFWDCKVNSMAIRLPATGLSTIDIGIMGLRMTTVPAADAPYFTGPAAASTSGVLAAVNGALYVEGVKIALLTSMDINIAANLSSEAVIGSNYKPDIFDGRIIVTGTMTVFFEDATFRDYFLDETEISVVAAFMDGAEADAEVLSFVMPRVKVGGAAKDDGEKGIVQTMPFTALFNTTGGAATGATATDALATTLSIQDSSIS